MVNLSPLLRGPILSMHCKTSRGEVCGKSGTNYKYKSPDRPLPGSCFKDLVRSCGRRSTRDQMSIMRTRMLAYPPSQLLFAFVTQRDEGEHVA